MILACHHGPRTDYTQALGITRSQDPYDDLVGPRSVPGQGGLGSDRLAGDFDGQFGSRSHCERRGSPLLDETSPILITCTTPYTAGFSGLSIGNSRLSPLSFNEAMQIRTGEHPIGRLRGIMGCHFKANEYLDHFHPVAKIRRLPE